MECQEACPSILSSERTPRPEPSLTHLTEESASMLISATVWNVRKPVPVSCLQRELPGLNPVYLPSFPPRDNDRVSVSESSTGTVQPRSVPLQQCGRTLDKIFYSRAP